MGLEGTVSVTSRVFQTSACSTGVRNLLVVRYPSIILFLDLIVSLGVFCKLLSKLLIDILMSNYSALHYP